MAGSIGNALFGKITMENFNRLSGEISDLQAQISSGKNDPRPSADPTAHACAPQWPLLMRHRVCGHRGRRT